MESPDETKLLPLRINKNTVFYFSTKEKRQSFIERFWDEKKQSFIIEGIRTQVSSSAAK